MNKIVIIGSGGAGKSTLARQLGGLLQIPVYHLDTLHWKPGWVETPNAELSKIQQSIFRKSRWIIDGNYSNTLEMRIQHADTIILLDFSRYLCLYRVLKRRIQYHNQTRPDMAPGCLEQLDLPFITRIWRYPKVYRPKIMEKLRHYKNEKQVIVLGDPREVRKFVKQVEDTTI